jgi:WD40 repeat protein
MVTIGCDGHAFIYSFPQEEGKEINLVKKIKISKSNHKPFDKTPIDAVWTADGRTILVSGEQTLGEITRGTWEYKLSKQIGHKKMITGLAWLSDNVLATASLDKVVKIWDYKFEKVLNFIQVEREIIQMAYC